MKGTSAAAPSTDVETEVSGMAAYQLRATDRCEVCGAQAYVITYHDAGPLYWCGHHYAANEEALAPRKVLDHRDMIDT